MFASVSASAAALMFSSILILDLRLCSGSTDHWLTTADFGPQINEKERSRKPQAYGLGMIIPGGRVVIIPFLDGLKVPAHVVDGEVRPVTLDPLIRELGEFLEGEYRHVALAHEVLS